MRTLLVSITAIFLVLVGSLGAAPAAERQMFVISSNADGYGVDRCLSTGAKCGMLVAAAYCHARAYAHAASFRKVDREDITGAIPQDRQRNCAGGTCNDLVAIVCTR
ncbi:MAG TPA: hypothetical protein VFX37_03020 [Pseudolabrys sp.]|nr:hypothetical protein [Pseudolabrys sp.]